jgi:dTDP-4-amino-4,6-dideoxygalactose transaminase
MRLCTLPEVIPFVDLKAQYRAIESDVQRAVTNVMETTAFILGPDVAAFEAEFARFIGLPHCTGVESGTAALKVALEAIGVGRGDEVLMPANTYIACAFAASQLGAVPTFVDMRDDYLIDVDQIEAAITPRTKVIMPVHLYGQVADIEAIVAIATRRGIKVLEDVSQAHGATVGGLRAGTFGDVAGFSFYPGKNLGAYGDGGAICTADAELDDRIRLLHDFGQRKKYEHLIVGDNSRLDTMQAAVLRVKLAHLERWNAQRLQAAKWYDELLTAADFAPPVRHTDEGHVYHLYVVRVAERERVMAELAAQGIQSGIHYPVPIHLQPAYRELGIPAGMFPRTEAAANTILSLPMFPEVTRAQVERVVAALRACAVSAEAVA